MQYLERLIVSGLTHKHFHNIHDHITNQKLSLKAGRTQGVNVLHRRCAFLSGVN